MIYLAEKFGNVKVLDHGGSLENPELDRDLDELMVEEILRRV